VIIRGWINTLEDFDIREGIDQHYEFPPRSRKYFVMAHVERHIAINPGANIDIALRPKTDLETRETALWLNDLLRRIHGAVR
jgi:hypothetical protein